jgi:hypothetical protein
MQLTTTFTLRKRCGSWQAQNRRPPSPLTATVGPVQGLINSGGSINSTTRNIQSGEKPIPQRRCPRPGSSPSPVCPAPSLSLSAYPRQRAFRPLEATVRHKDLRPHPNTPLPRSSVTPRDLIGRVGELPIPTGLASSIMPMFLLDQGQGNILFGSTLTNCPLETIIHHTNPGTYTCTNLTQSDIPSIHNNSRREDGTRGGRKGGVFCCTTWRGMVQ